MSPEERARRQAKAEQEAEDRALEEWERQREAEWDIYESMQEEGY